MPTRDFASEGGYLMPLDAVTTSNVGEVGSKAANLGELARAGFPVPEGIALTTKAFERFIQANGLDGGLEQGVVASGRMPQDVRKAMAAVSKKFGETLLAVRSSCVSEDLAGASFAGQYETFLGVRNRAELEDAVKKCWASAFSPRVRSYKDTRDADSTPMMGVLVQRLIRAEAAGVAFTANPVTGNRGEVIINSVMGLGERLVSGGVTPDTWVVRGNEVSCTASLENAIDGDKARSIAELARRVEAHFGSPQDIEWAISSGVVYLLQARPITSLLEGKIAQAAPVPIPMEVPEGFWMLDEEHFGTPVSPMEASITRTWLKPSTERFCEDLGLPFEGVDAKTIGGYLYMRMVPPGGKDRSPPPSWLMPLLVRLVPQVRSMNKKCAEAVRTDKRGRFVASWYEELQPDVDRRTGVLSQKSLPSLTDHELEEHVSSAVSLYEEVAEMHFKLVFGMSLSLRRFSSFCEASLGWSRRTALEMLGSKRTREPSRRLEELAKMASERPAVARLLEEGDGGGVFRSVGSVDPGFADALQAYLKDCCYVTVGYDISMPTVDENQSLIVGLIRRQMERKAEGQWGEPADRKRQELVDEARSSIKAKGQSEAEKFDRLLKDADRAYGAIDDTQFYTMKSRGLVRKALLEVGERLEKRGVLKKPEDIFFLEIGEMTKAFQGAETNLLDLIARRKGERLWADAHPVPKSYGRPPGPPPPMKSFPPEVREVMESFTWMFENVGLGPTERMEGSLTGLGGSAGRYTGAVRVVKDETEFWKVRPGDVLVCQTTAPTWTVLFSGVGALVTDMGGLLSHPAIIAREYRIPAVLATGNATKLLHDDEIVTVDGELGTVRKEAPSHMQLDS